MRLSINGEKICNRARNKAIMLVVFTLVIGAEAQVDVNKNCFRFNDQVDFAGITFGDELSDMGKLEEIMTTEMRIWGF